MKLSIIIPIYNGERYIKHCLESILQQNDGQIEIIVVNDGSTDSTMDICEEYSKQYECITCINKINEGVSKARNVAIQHAKGEWITFLDADDMIQNNSINSILQVLNSDVDVVICDYSQIQVDNIVHNMRLRELPKEIMKKGILNLPSYLKEIRKTAENFDGVINWTCWGKVYRTQLIRENNIVFPIGITHGEDLLFCFKVYECAKKIAYCPINLYFYRVNEISVSRTFNRKRIDNTIKLFDNIIQANKELKDDLDFQHFVVDRIIACCKLYFVNDKNEKTEIEKINELEKLVQKDYISKAIISCPAKKLSLGKKTNLINTLILYLLKRKKYKWVLCVSKI